MSIILFTACKKVENFVTANDYKNQINHYFKSKELVSNTHLLGKINKLKSDIEYINLIKIKSSKNTEAIIANLKTYSIINKNGYLNIYYKVVFQLRNNIITDAFVYTIRTNSSEHSINSDIENVLKNSSKSFTGEVIINGVDSRYLLTETIKNGQLEKIEQIQEKINNKKKSTIVSQSTIGSFSNCIDWYTVTTTFNTDGTYDEQWQFNRTVCSGNCIPTGEPVSIIVPDCDGDSYGGNPQSPSNSDSTNPCKNADSLANNTDYKLWMDSLKKLTTNNFETGAYYSRNSTGSYSFTMQQGTAGTGNIISSLSIKIDGYMHNHYQGLLSIFSGTDILQMYNFLKDDKMNDPSKFTMSLVSDTSGTSYLMQIDNLSLFKSFGEKWLKNDLIFYFFEDLYTKRYAINPNASIAHNLSGFLKMLTEYNTGIKFFVGNSDFTQWKPKEFKILSTSTTGNIIDSPCN